MAHLCGTDNNMNCTGTYNARGCLGEARALKLTAISDNERVRSGLAAVRRERLSRTFIEARLHGGRHTCSALCIILLASRYTLKRDVGYLRSSGHALSFAMDVRASRV